MIPTQHKKLEILDANSFHHVESLLGVPSHSQPLAEAFEATSLVDNEYEFTQQ